MAAWWGTAVATTHVPALTTHTHALTLNTQALAAPQSKALTIIILVAESVGWRDLWDLIRSQQVLVFALGVNYYSIFIARPGPLCLYVPFSPKWDVKLKKLYLQYVEVYIFWRLHSKTIDSSVLLGNTHSSKTDKSFYFGYFGNLYQPLTTMFLCHCSS